MFQDIEWILEGIVEWLVLHENFGWRHIFSIIQRREQRQNTKGSTILQNYKQCTIWKVNGNCEE